MKDWQRELIGGKTCGGALNTCAVYRGNTVFMNTEPAFVLNLEIKASTHV